MSSIVSQESKIMLRELLAVEKGDTRVWLRAEMDRLVDPLLDTLFNRLETKLTNGLERTQFGDGDCALVGNPSATELPNHPSQSLVLIAQPSPSPSLAPSLNSTLSHFNPQFANLNYSHSIPFNLQSPGQSPVPPPPVSIINQIILPNQLTNVQSQCSMPIKHEIDPTEPNEPMAESQFAQSLSAPIVNEQTNHNNWNEEDGEEECDCDDCVNGIIEEIKIEDDDSDSIEWIEEGQEESSRPVKKPRLDPTQPNNAQQAEAIRQYSRQATQPNQVNNQDTQCITLSLQCTESGCSEMFAGVDSVNQLNDHMSEKHFLDLNRCLVRDCAQSFENKSILSQHLKQSHQHTTQWHCNKCPKQFSSYKVLSNHCKCYHQLGLFQCSFPTCTFTGECKQKVINHYTQQHKETLKCLHPGCQYETPKVSNFKQHQLSHLGIKPYRCKWLQCHYSAVQRCNVINHIRNIHLAPNPGSGPNKAQLDPKDYVELVHDLL